MNKEFIPYEQALELKQLGFNEQCLAYYKFGNMLHFEYVVPTNQLVVAPLYQQAFAWFREKHNMIIGIDFKTHDKNGYFYSISWQKWANGEEPPVLVWHHLNSWLGANEPLSSYEEAELACLKKLIEIVKNK